MDCVATLPSTTNCSVFAQHRVVWAQVLASFSTFYFDATKSRSVKLDQHAAGAGLQAHMKELQEFNQHWDQKAG